MISSRLTGVPYWSGLALCLVLMAACESDRPPAGLYDAGIPDAPGHKEAGEDTFVNESSVSNEGGTPDQAVPDFHMLDMFVPPDMALPDSAPDQFVPPDMQLPDQQMIDLYVPDQATPDACVKNIYWIDNDLDGWGGDTKYVAACKRPAGYASKKGDCDDNDKTIYPGAKEICNKKDDNCNTFIDEGLPTTPFYKDDDGDGYGTTSTLQACGAPQGYVAQSGDCNDNNKEIYPGAKEKCNEVDDNCNGYTDEGFIKKSFFKDNDKDGYGGVSSKQSCTAGTGYVAKGGDCNDYNKNIHPYATELCNLIDDDCNGIKDDKLKKLKMYKDNDGDGFAAKNAITQEKCDVPVGWALPKDVDGDKKNDWDCDDSDVTVYPGAPTKCGDGKDNNCDGYTDRLCFTACSGNWKSTPYKLQYSYSHPMATAVDLDGDGYMEIVVQDQFGFAILNHLGKAHYQYSAQTYNYSRNWAVVADVDDYDKFGAATQTLEVLTGNSSKPMFYKLNANSTVTTYTGKTGLYDASRFMVRDMDHDGVPEFFSTSWCEGNAGTKVFRFDRKKGSFTHVVSVADPDKVCEYTDGRTLTDLNGDGVPELVFGNGYAQSYAPKYWGGKVHVTAFTNLKTLAHKAYCKAGTCFNTAVSGLYPGATYGTFRVGSEIRTQVTYFTSNTPNVANPGTTRYWAFDLAGKALSGSPSKTNTMWNGTTDVDSDGKPDDYGAYVAYLGLYDVNGDGYPDRIYGSGSQLRIALFDKGKKAFVENVGSRQLVSAKSVYPRSAWDINGDGRLEVISSGADGSIYCHTLGKTTWNRSGVLPPRFTPFMRTYQWDNLEPNEGADTNKDGIPDETIQIPSALTHKANLHSYLSTAKDKDYYLIATGWGGKICLTAPKGKSYKLKVYSFKDRWNNASHVVGADGKADGLLWSKDTAKGGSTCFYGSYVMPPRYGEYKFVIGVEPASATDFSPYWPYWIQTQK